MFDKTRRPWAWLRVVALACVAVLGLATIVGSGGGSLGFPPCPPDLCVPPPPPSPAATVAPAYITALVGTPVTYTVTTSNLAGNLSYQWRRSSDGGSSFVDIAGATGSSYTLPGVNLADDGALFLVEVHSDSSGVRPQALSHLVVSATPGIVFADGEFQPADWLVSPVIDQDHAVFVHTEERVATGGNPGAYRKLVFQLTAGVGSERVFYSSLSSTYDPAAQGGIHVIDYAEDCRALQSSDTTYSQSSLVIEQSGRRYLSNTNGACTSTAWSAVASRASLAAPDFRLFDGPACGTGESCPDFSSSAAPMRFGYWRITFGVPGDSIAHGIDNWKVTVWRR